MPDVTAPARATLGEATFVSVAFADIGKCARASWVVNKVKDRLRFAVVAVRGGGGGGSVPGVCRVIGYVGAVPAQDIVFQGNLSDETPQGTSGRKFCDTLIATADLFGCQPIPLNFPVNRGETCTLVVSPIVGSAGGANAAAFLCTMMLLGDDVDDGAVTAR